MLKFIFFNDVYKKLYSFIDMHARAYVCVCVCVFRYVNHTKNFVQKLNKFLYKEFV